MDHFYGFIEWNSIILFQILINIIAHAKKKYSNIKHKLISNNLLQKRHSI